MKKIKNEVSPLETILSEISDIEDRGRVILDLLGDDVKVHDHSIKEMIWENYQSNQKITTLLKHFEDDSIHLNTKKERAGLVTIEISLPQLRWRRLQSLSSFGHR